MSVHRATDAVHSLLVSIILPRFKSLTALTISDLSLTTKSTVPLFKQLATKLKISMIQLINTGISSKNLHALVSILPSLRNLYSINLHGNQLAEDAINDLLVCVSSHSSLRMLYLSSNRIRMSNALSLASVLQNSSVRDLFLTNCGIDDAVMAVVCEALCSNSVLRTLSVSSNPIDDNGAAAFAKTLTKNSTLQMVNLWGTLIGKEGTIRLLSSLCVNVSIITITLSVKLEEQVSRFVDESNYCGVIRSRILWL